MLPHYLLVALKKRTVDWLCFQAWWWSFLTTHARRKSPYSKVPKMLLLEEEEANSSANSIRSKVSVLVDMQKHNAVELCFSHGTSQISFDPSPRTIRTFTNRIGHWILVKLCFCGMWWQCILYLHLNSLPSTLHQISCCRGWGASSHVIMLWQCWWQRHVMRELQWRWWPGGSGGVWWEGGLRAKLPWVHAIWWCKPRMWARLLIMVRRWIPAIRGWDGHGGGARGSFSSPCLCVFSVAASSLGWGRPSPSFLSSVVVAAALSVLVTPSVLVSSSELLSSAGD